MKAGVLVGAGAVGGGILGYFAFLWAVRQGFYALILPGALAGLGAGLFHNRSKPLAVLCGVFGLAMGFLAEWKAFPFSADDSLGYFFAHIHQLKPVTLLLIGAGGVFAFWVPFRRKQVRRPTPNEIPGSN